MKTVVFELENQGEGTLEIRAVRPTCGCTVAEFDDPELQSMAEEMLTSPVGGAIVGMGATTPTFASAHSTPLPTEKTRDWTAPPTSPVSGS